MNKALSGLIGRLSGVPGGGDLSGRLVRGGIGGILIRVSATALSFLVAVVLARALGAEGYGVYAYAYALVLLMATPAEFGLSALVVRETAKAEALSQWGLMRGVWRWASLAAGLMAMLFAVVAGGLAWVFAARFSETQLTTFAWGLVLVPMIALAHLRGAALRGLGRVVTGQLPDAILRPVFLLLLFAGAVTVIGYEDASSSATAMGLQTLAAGLASLVGAALLLRARPSDLLASRPVFEGRQWFASALPLSLMGGMLVINQQVGIIVLGIFHPADEVGVYKVVMQGALLINFGMQVVNAVVAPYFSRFHTQNDMQRLQAIVTGSARFSLALALPVLVVCVVWGDDLLRAFFGGHFASGYLALVILSTGYCISVAIGLANTLLNMTGFEQQTARSVVVAVIANVLLTLVCIPAMGMNGAALAAALSLVVWKVQLWSVARHRLGLESAAIRFTRRRKSPQARH